MRSWSAAATFSRTRYLRKSPSGRPSDQGRYGANRGYIEELTEFAFQQSDERRKIILLCTLDEVRASVASALLRFGHDASYPILDRRALWSLRGLLAYKCTAELWPEYVRECRAEAAEYRVSVRDLDKALWQFSFEKQGGERNG